MTDIHTLKVELRKVKKNLIRGDQRDLAITLGAHPNKIANAFDGFINDLKFLRRLQAEAQKLTESRTVAAGL